MLVIIILGIILVVVYVLYKKAHKKNKDAEIFYQEIMRATGVTRPEDEGRISHDHKLKVSTSINSIIQNGGGRKHVENVSFAEARSFASDKDNFEDLSEHGLIRFCININRVKYHVMVQELDSTLRQQRGSTFEIYSDEEMQKIYEEQGW